MMNRSVIGDALSPGRVGVGRCIGAYEGGSRAFGRISAAHDKGAGACRFRRSLSDALLLVRWSPVFLADLLRQPYGFERIGEVVAPARRFTLKEALNASHAEAKRSIAP